MENTERSARRRTARAYRLLLPLLFVACAASPAAGQWSVPEQTTGNIHTTSNVEVGPGPAPGQPAVTEKLVNTGGAVFGGARARTELWPGFTSGINPALFELNSGAPVSNNSRFAALSLVTSQSGASGSVGAVYFSNSASGGGDKRLGSLGVGTDGAVNSGVMAFYTASSGSLSERMRITSAGRVGIGTDSPGFALDVQGGRINASGGLCIASVCKGSWAEVGGAALWAAASGSNISYVAGNVGVGTPSPRARLEVSGGADTALLIGDRGTSGKVGLQFLGSGYRNAALTFDGDNVVVEDASDTYAPSNWYHPNSVMNFVVRKGSVGINTGVTLPAHTLEVNGTINASGGITGANINVVYQDVAEWVPTAQKLSEGTVVVLDAERTNHVLASTASYDTKVAGVVSARPGISLGEGGEGKALVATTGRVKVKVDATRAPIHVGDLLVTSDMEGAAMKSVPVDVGGRKMHAPGTIIGKALEPLASGTGEILVLLSLQ